MTTSASDLTSAANSLLAFIQARKNNLQNLETQFLSLGTPQNAALPGALNSFNNLLALRDQEAEIWNENTQYTSFIQLYNNAPESAKTAAVKALKDSVLAQGNSLIELGRNQKTTTIPNTKSAIETAIRGAPPQIAPANAGPAGSGTAPDGPSGAALLVEQQQAADPNRPGRRMKNPLGWFSSYTYQLTLYMISPAAYNEYVQSGKLQVPAAGSFIVAQSGGIPTDRRAPNMPYDYYIDNLKIMQAVGTQSTATATGISEISFTITEPLGFSLIRQLKQMQSNFQSISGSGDYKKLQNPLKHFFIIGIRFYGYDSEGNLQRGSNEYEGNPLDPNWGGGEGQAVFERFIDFVVSDFKFKIDGKAVVYQISGTSGAPATGATVKRGMLNTNMKVEGSTVKSALAQLMDKLNADQEELFKNKKIKEKNKYMILGINDTYDRSTHPIPNGADVIFNSTIVLPENKSKQQWATNPAQNTGQVNENKGAKSTPNNTKKVMQVNRDTPVLQIINQIISGSSYVRDAMQEVNKGKLEPSEKPNSNTNKPDTNKKVNWYNVSIETTNGRFDSVTSDFAYDILYIIKPYETPVVNSAYANKGINYPGPHKRYEYWYTGENREILQFELTFDTLYFTETLNPSIDKSGKGAQGAADVGQVPNKSTNQDKTGTIDKEKEAQNNYINSLYDPNAFAETKITILGDPDFLMQDQESTKNLNAAYRKFYGNDGFSVNPTSGQVLVEIDFKEAIDYNTEKGYLDINDDIILVPYPPAIKAIVKGVSFLVVDVTHNFSNGKFTQTLNLTANFFGDGPPPITQQRPT